MTKVVALGILLRGDHVLLVKRAASRAFNPGVWDFPGGHSEDGESPEQALARELTEELGVVPKEYREHSQSINGEGLLILRYCVTQWTGTPSNLQEREHSEIAWVRLAEVDKLEFAHPDIPRLLQAMQK